MTQTPETPEPATTAETPVDEAPEATPAAPRDPIAEAVAPGYEFDGPGARAGRADAQRHRPVRRAHPDPAGHAQPARPGRRRDRHRQDQDAAAAGRAAQRRRRTGLRRRHQGRPLRAQPRRASPARRSPSRAASVGQEWTATGFPVEYYALGGAGHRHPAAGDHDVVRADAAEQGARPQRHPGVQPRPDLPLRRQGRPAAARPRRPACRRRVPDQRRGQGRPQGARRPVVRDRRRDPARADLVPGPGRRRVLRRARVRVQATSCRSPPTARA